MKIDEGQSSPSLEYSDSEFSFLFDPYLEAFQNNKLGFWLGGGYGLKSHLGFDLGGCYELRVQENHHLAIGGFK